LGYRFLLRDEHHLAGEARSLAARLQVKDPAPSPAAATGAKSMSGLREYMQTPA